MFQIFNLPLLRYCNVLRYKNKIYKNRQLNLIPVVCFHSSCYREHQTESTVRDIPIQFEEKFKNGHCSTTGSEEELKKFRFLGDSWWDIEGKLKPLHALNKLRVALIRDGLIQSGLAKGEHKFGPQPLKSLQLLDVGCGGGILCEPLARLGAEVTGLDAASENISVADTHAQSNKRITSNIKYIVGTIEEFNEEFAEKYDGVIISEVLEHVESPDLFLNCCTSALKPGGSIFVTTLNKTTRSWVAAIVIAEYIMGLLPRGSHDWNKFIAPSDLCSMLESRGCVTQLIHGMAYIPIRNEWFWISDSSVNYAVHAVKQHSEHST